MAAVAAVSVDNYFSSNGKSVATTSTAEALNSTNGNNLSFEGAGENDWPSGLRAAVVESFSRKIDEKGARGYLQEFNWPSGLADALILNVNKIPIRFVLVDDSGSMCKNDGLRIVGKQNNTKIISCTRFAHLKPL
jgi:hypothetical protein